jgi:sugar phosphate isomerase/epimerase
VARAFNLEGLEIRSIWDTRVDQLAADQVRRLKSAADEAGLVIAAVAPPFYKCDVDSPEERREHLDILRRTIDVAHRLDTTLIRTFTFWKKYPLDQIWDRLVESYAEPLDLARAAGVTLAVENEYACHVGTGRELGRFLDALARPEAAALWDPCNAYFDRASEVPYPDGYAAVRGRIAHVHLKDAGRDPGAEKPHLTPLGEGAVDIAGQLAALVADGYRGFVSLETHWRPGGLDEATARLPGGKSFSEQGAVATIRCLENWDRLMAAQPG